MKTHIWLGFGRSFLSYANFLDFNFFKWESSASSLLYLIYLLSLPGVGCIYVFSNWRFFGGEKWRGGGREEMNYTHFFKRNFGKRNDIFEITWIHWLTEIELLEFGLMLKVCSPLLVFTSCEFITTGAKPMLTPFLLGITALFERGYKNQAKTCCFLLLFFLSCTQEVWFA